MGASFDFNDTGAAVIKPSHLAHMVLFANDYSNMKTWWQNFLGAKIAFEKPDTLALLSYDYEHHRLGLVARPSQKPSSTTFAHVGFTYDSLEELLLAYRQRLRLHGVKPRWCVNHGPTISLYYEDPEGNGIETQFDVFKTSAEADEYMRSDAFTENPIGVDFDPEDFIRRHEAGEAVESLCIRPSIGPRGMPPL